jgi:3-hydroxymyristoyl/3-hydroxydecanoyl-(acyl carrier protein) dehydratase
LAVAEWPSPADHPAAQGHFPGNPVIPGAVLLAEALRAIEAGLGHGLEACRIPSAKFPAPARPGDRVAIEYWRSTDGAIRFTCRVGARVVLVGGLRCGFPPAEA